MQPLIRKVDCIRLRVPDLDAALAFYRDHLGHALIWRSATAAGLSMPDCDAELVVHTESTPEDASLMVESVEAAVARITAAGGRLLAGPFEITIGRCAVVADPFGNALTLLDNSKGRLETDADGTVTGVTSRQTPRSTTNHQLRTTN